MYTFKRTPKNQIAPNVYSLPIAGVLFVASERFLDSRGFFAQLAILPDISQHLPQPFLPLQINHSHSRQNVIRGFHAENWNKLVTVIQGECYVALADFRPNSATFGEAVNITLGTTEKCQYGSVFIPAGVGNSSLALSPVMEYLYFVDQLYADRDPSGDIAVSLFDPDLAVPWPINKQDLIYSQRDTQAVMLREKYPHKFSK